MQNKILKPTTITLFIILCLLIVFHVPVENLINTTLVKYVLAYCEKSPLNNFIFILLSIGLIIYSYIHRKAIIANNTLIILLIVSTIYLFYRITDATWSFTPFYKLEGVKYFDIVLLATALPLVIKALKVVQPKREQKGEKQSISFFNDEPIDENKPDELGYNEYAKTVAGKIESSNFENSFAIGVNGKWGMGKTSFFNLIKANLTSDNHILVDFNSWNSSSSTAIIQDFFDTLQDELRPYYSSLAQQLIKYANKLSSLNDNTFTQSFRASTVLLTGDSSISNLHEAIDHKLRKIGKKLIIFVDDLDRLDKYEILEVMRLIRNTANFYNTIFIVAYDRDYVLKAVQDYNSHNYQSYLEKIFQLEINLPAIDTSIFKDNLLKNLKAIFPKNLHQSITTALFRQYFEKELNFTSWLTSLRDVTRLTNSISVTMEGLQGEVYIKDFIYLQLLRLKFPAVYEHISVNYFKYFTTQQQSSIKHKYILTPNKDNIVNINTARADQLKTSSCSTEIEKHLILNLDRYSIDEGSVKNIIELLELTFNKHAYDYQHHQDFLSVVYPIHFRKYFTYNLTNNNLSEVAFTNARLKSQTEFNKFILARVSEGLDRELKTRFEDIREYESREDFEKIIRGIFYLANLKPTDNDRYFSIVGYNDEDLINKLSMYDSSASTKFYPSPEEYLLFFLSLFKEATYPFTFESRLIGRWLKNSNWNLPVTKDDLVDCAVSYFEEYANRNNQIDDEFWRFFQYTHITIQAEDGTKKEIIPDKARHIFKKFILTKDLEGFLKSLIVPDRNNSARFSLTNYVLTFWKNWDEFLDILEANKDVNPLYIKEFIDFYNLLSVNGIETPIEYKFDVIPIDLSY
ncbi:hypothetical protein H8S95_03610 [Pontibacter sp. KCTC 32443]|uniref:KAP family P-loop NTPase fold protein n=1 Tax=Pontibacter TaxID=323449 RepID=UPI00164E83E3|nr:MULTISPECIES: P-loop NTPase fold protein [Pontibacter]MBC5773139.1 hypothetical protein [Pontibacter sp. KCTC 32443]